MCRRSSSDPLIRLLCRKHQFNLLRHPREGARTGDIYVWQPQAESATSAKLSSLLEPAVEFPPFVREKLADLEDVESDAIDLNVGLGFLQGFFQALGVGNVLGSVKAAYAKKGAKTLRIRIADAVRESVDAGLIGDHLKGRRLKDDHPLAIPGSRFYVSGGVVRASTIAVTAETVAGHLIDLDASLLQTVNVNPKLDVKSELSSEVIYRGDVPLAIAVELFELTWTKGDGSLRLRVPKDYVPTRGDHPVMRLSDGEDAEAFIDVA